MQQSAATTAVKSAGAAVKFDGVQKSYDGETLVVKDLHLDIAPGNS